MVPATKLTPHEQPYIFYKLHDLLKTIVHKVCLLLKVGSHYSNSIGFLGLVVSLHGQLHQFIAMMKEIRKYGMVCLSFFTLICIYIMISLIFHFF